MISAATALGKGNEGSGGGSGVAAEITYATDSFIATVKKHPNLFPGVDPEALSAMNPNIFIAHEPIQFCNKLGTLEAYSNKKGNYSRFVLSSWLGKTWEEKVLLAGHERLVLAGLEKSNQYHISSKLYDAKIQELEAKYGEAESICSISEYACAETKKVERHFVGIVENVRTGGYGVPTAKKLFQMAKLALDSMILSTIEQKQIEIDREIFGVNKEARKKEVEEKTMLAVGKHFRPMIRQLEQLAESGKNNDEVCVSNTNELLNNETSATEVSPAF